jgi:PAT family beta-lactamase induction signal transducer AmpG
VNGARPLPAADRGPWWWVPSLYFAEAVPLVVVTFLATVMFKRFGVANREITLIAGWLYLPWVIKPLWSMLVEGRSTRRTWTLVTEVLVAGALGLLAAAVGVADPLRATVVVFAILAFLSATHDVAADGFYLAALDDKQQAFFVGIRSTAYRIANVVGRGLLVMLAGGIESATGPEPVEVRAIAVAAPPASAGEDWRDWEVIRDADGSQRILVQRADVVLVTTDPELGESSGEETTAADGTVRAVRAWNVRHRFQPADDPPLQSPVTGDTAVVALRLAEPPKRGSDLVVQFDRTAGDSRFRIVTGERFTVSADNWQNPFLAVVAASPGLPPDARARFTVRAGDVRAAWRWVYAVLAVAFLATAAYHAAVLPKPASDRRHEGPILSFAALADPVLSFFRKPGIARMLAFLLLYRLGEAQLVSLVSPFLLDTRARGGLGLTTSEVGWVYGTLGIVMLSLGGIVGGLLVARDGLGRWLWPMALAINLPNLAYVWLGAVQPESLWAIGLAVGLEQFGYGFGFTAYMVYCMVIARGSHQTVHYALCTGFMAAGMMLPSMVSGWIQESLGYPRFFLWVLAAAVPGLVATALISLDAAEGRREAS